MFQSFQNYIFTLKTLKNVQSRLLLSIETHLKIFLQKKIEKIIIEFEGLANNYSSLNFPQIQNLEYFYLFIIIMISFQNLKVQAFKQEHIPQYMEFVYDSYFHGNKLFDSLSQGRESLESDTLKLITQFIQSADYVNKLRGTNTPFNTFIRIDGKMAVACFSCELHRFMKRFAEGRIPQPMYSDLPSNILVENPQFSAVMGIRHTVRKQYFGKGLYDLHSRLRAEMLRNDGYNYRFGITVNQNLIDYYIRRGYQLTPLKYEKWEKVLDLYLCKASLAENPQSKL